MLLLCVLKMVCFLKQLLQMDKIAYLTDSLRLGSGLVMGLCVGTGSSVEYPAVTGSAVK